MQDASGHIRNTVLGTLTESTNDALSDNYRETAQNNVSERELEFKGIVVDNNDPEKMGRVRVQVFGVFDDIPVNHLPWATPEEKYMGSTMGSFIVPPNGAVVKVYFENNEIYNPVYTCRVTDKNSLNFVSNPGEDYPDTKVFFENDNGEFFKTNTRTGQTVYRHSSGVIIMIDGKGNTTISTKASGSSMFIESGGEINISAKASINIESDDHIFLGAKVICTDTPSMTKVKGDLVVEGNLIGTTGMLDFNHFHLGNIGLPTSPPPTKILPKVYAGGGNLAEGSGSGYTPPPVQQGNPQLEEMNPPVDPVPQAKEDAKTMEEPSMSEIDKWKQEFKEASEKWILAKHFYETANLTYTELVTLPTYYIAFQKTYNTKIGEYETEVLKQAAKMKETSDKINAVVAGIKDGKFQALKDKLPQIEEKVKVENKGVKIEHFSSNIPKEIVRDKILNFKDGAFMSIREKFTIGANGILYSKEVSSQTVAPQGMLEAIKMSDADYKPLKFKDCLGNSLEYSEKENELKYV